AAQLDLLAGAERRDDAVEDGVDDHLGLLLRELGGARDLLDEVRLGGRPLRAGYHRKYTFHPPPTGAPARKRSANEDRDESSEEPPKRTVRSPGRGGLGCHVSAGVLSPAIVAARSTASR